MMLDILKALFGGRNVVTDIAGAFIPNAEKSAQRDHEGATNALDQFGQEFQSAHRKHWFDRFIDGLNRVPRPLMAFGVIGLFVSAMIDPVWFSERMVGIALVPDPLWWLLGAIVTFYFGARYQAKVQNFDIKKQVAGVSAVVAGRKAIEEIEDPAVVEVGQAAIPEEEITADLQQSTADRNPVIDNWAMREGR